VVISFDDGWAAQGGVVKTFLEPRGMKAVLFVFTGAVGPTRNGGGYISWEELRELEAAGHEVQSHTVSHGRLTQMLPPQLEREMRESKAIIERETKHPCRVVAYPYGDHDRAVMLAAHRAGYDCAVRADDDPGTGPVSAYRMPRVRVGYGDGIEVFAAAMERASAPESE
jgi:peptidoglycan/xylan/chitin deacetylase (PgdA/CDA1 family)